MRCVLSLCLALVAAIAVAQPSEIGVPYGIHGPSFSHSGGDWEAGNATFDAFDELGVDWARMAVWWSLASSEAGWDFDFYDRAFAEYEERGVCLMPILTDNLQGDFANAPATQHRITEFGDFTEKIVRRNRDFVREWEIWNEPNILPFWTPQPNVADYAALLIEAHRRAKIADPTCVIVAGATAGADFDFIQGLFDHGAGNSFDVLSYHAYTQTPDRAAVMNEVRALRALLDENGREDAPIWLTEHGLFTGPRDVDERTQAREIVRLAAWRYAAGVERQVYLALEDWVPDTPETTAFDFWGVMRHDGSRKESFAAMQTMLRAIEGRPCVGEVIVHPHVEGVFFGGHDENAMVLWASEPTTFTLDAGVSALVTESLLGERQEFASDNGVYVLTIGEDPVWLFDVGDERLLLAEAGIEERSVTTSQAGETIEIHCVTSAVSFHQTFQIPASLEEHIGSTITLIADGPPDYLFLEFASAQNPLIKAEDTGWGEGMVAGMRLTIVPELTISPLPPIGVAGKESVTVPSMPPLKVHGEFLLLRASFSNETSSMIPLWWWGTWLDGQCIYADNERDDSQSGGAHWIAPVPLSLTNDGNRHVIRHHVHDMHPYNYGASRSMLDFQPASSTLTQSIRLFEIPRVSSAPVIDGDLSDWSTPATISPEHFTEYDFNPANMGGDDDMALTAWMGWNESGLYLALRVEDDTLVLPENTVVWDADGLQLAFDTLADAREGVGYDANDIEIEIGWHPEGRPIVFAGQYPPGRPASVVTERVELAAQIDDAGITYEIFIPAAVLVPLPLEAGKVFGFNLIHNDNDGAGREGWVELDPGIGLGKEPERFPWFALMP